MNKMLHNRCVPSIDVILKQGRGLSKPEISNSVDDKSNRLTQPKQRDSDSTSIVSYIPSANGSNQQSRFDDMLAIHRHNEITEYLNVL